MLLSGYTGLFSLGHAAFLGVGAYTEAVLGNAGWPFPLSFAAAGLVCRRCRRRRRPAGAARQGHLPGDRDARLRLHRRRGVRALGERHRRQRRQARDRRRARSAGALDDDVSFYFVCLVVALGATLAILNLLRSPTGRAFVAIRDSEVSAQSMGIHLARYKTLSFAISAALAGIGGALYAHKLKFISPDQFDILQSIDLILMIVVGGIGSVHGAFLGAIFLITMPQVIALAKDVLPPLIGQAPGLQGAVYGFVLIGFVLFEPLGLYGRWLKLRTYLQIFPFYRRGMFRRQKSFLKSDRLK